MTDLVFPDQQGYADLATLVRRARQADPDAAVRLQVTGAVLRVWVGVLPGTGLLADGTADTFKGSHAALMVEPLDGRIRVTIAGKAFQSPLEAAPHNH